MFGLPLLAVAGAIFAVTTVAAGSRPPAVADPVADPAQAPFESYVAGSGIVESSSQNVAIGAPVSRIAMDVKVAVGAEVKLGDVLFRLDDRDLRAEQAVRGAAIASARARLERLQSLPRPEEIPPAEARVKTAESTLADLTAQWQKVESLADKRAVSAEEVSRRQFAAQAAEARLAEAKAQLALLKAGAWKAEIDVARAEIAAAEAQAKSIEIEIDRLSVRAPLDATVLQVNVRAGEFAPAGVAATPLMVLGATQRLHVRVDVDENDAWRFKPGAAAIAFVRGNRELKADLKFVRVDPMVIPKRSLTGDATERVDTRVLQVLFSFDRSAMPVYVGQQMDVFIEAPRREAKK